MAIGVDISRRHLDELQAADWTQVATTAGAAPIFAGRYFLGSRFVVADANEQTPITPSVSWAHSEAPSGDVVPTLKWVLPIQPGNPERQSLQGPRGKRAGKADGEAICRRVQSTLLMSELTWTQQFIKVFLEVLDGTALSSDYWQAWATAVHSYVVQKKNPFQPCIQCKFAATSQGPYAPVAEVQAALQWTKRTNFRTQCGVFWARVPWNAPKAGSAPVLDDNAFPAFPQLITKTKSAGVPVWFWQYAPAPQPDPGLSISVVRDGIDLSKSFPQLVRGWQLQPNAVTALGFDLKIPNPNPAAAATANCARVTIIDDAVIAASILPNEPAPPPAPDVTALKLPLSFMGRYYDSEPKASSKIPTADDQKVWSAANFRTVMTWQSAYTWPVDKGGDGRSYQNGWPSYYLDCQKYGNRCNDYRVQHNLPIRGIDYFLHGYIFGLNDGLVACHRALKYKQPERTPIYFAVDFLPGWQLSAAQVNDLWQPPYQEPDKTNQMNGVLAYFKGVAQGFLKYRSQPANKKIYKRYWEIGAYAHRSVLELLYQQGIVSYFWELRGAPEIAGSPYFPYANVVQRILNKFTVCNLYSLGHDANGNPVNARLDLDLSWGDEGSW